MRPSLSPDTPTSDISFFSSYYLYFWNHLPQAETWTHLLGLKTSQNPAWDLTHVAETQTQAKPTVPGFRTKWNSDSWCLIAERIQWETKWHEASQVAWLEKNLPANVGDVSDGPSIPGSGRSPREGNSNLLQSSYLENPIGKECLMHYISWGHKESDMTEQLRMQVVDLFRINRVRI